MLRDLVQEADQEMNTRYPQNFDIVAVGLLHALVASSPENLNMFYHLPQNSREERATQASALKAHRAYGIPEFHLALGEGSALYSMLWLNKRNRALFLLHGLSIAAGIGPVLDQYYRIAREKERLLSGRKYSVFRRHVKVLSGGLYDFFKSDDLYPLSRDYRETFREEYREIDEYCGRPVPAGITAITAVVKRMVLAEALKYKVDAAVQAMDIPYTMKCFMQDWVNYTPSGIGDEYSYFHVFAPGNQLPEQPSMFRQ